MASPVQVQVLGPLRLLVDGAEVPVPGPLRAAVLAVLALEPGQVSDAALIDALWGAAPPDSAANSLQSHVSRLRGHLGRHADLLRRTGSGYRLDLPDDAVDARRVRRQVEQAHVVTEPIPLQERAIATWRGPALAEFPEIAPLAAEAARFAELHRSLVDELLDAKLRSGAVPVEEATAAAGTEPLRESTQLLLMRALAAAGRSADALAVAQSYRRRLVEETGLEPGPVLAETTQRIAAGELAAAGRGTRLPRPPTPLLGRDDDVDRLLGVLEANRCVTLVGPGGVGKTRLAMELAGRAAVEVRLVELAPVAETGVAAFVLAQALGVRGGADLSEVLEYLAGRQMLLLIDNCEHLIDEVRELCGSLLRWTPVTVLATSRRRLGVAGEWVYRLEPLPGEAAVAIFVDRARRATGGAGVPAESLPEVADLCHRLDGLPLAIELAAAWLPTVGLAGLRERSDVRLGAGPAADSGARQATLRSTIAWSYELLDDEARTVFRRLSVVPDGFELDVVRDGAELVPLLVDQSLLVATPGPDAMRYRMLEGIRAFGREQLDESGELHAALDDLIAWAVRFVEQAGEGLRTVDEPAWNRRVIAAIPGLRAAREELLRRADLPGLLAVTVGLVDFALWREQAEIWNWALQLARLPGIEQQPRAATALAVACQVAWRLGNLQLAAELVDRADALVADEVDRVTVDEAAATTLLFETRYEESLQLFLRAALAAPDRLTGGAAFGTAALAAGYGGVDASELLAQADRVAEATGSPTARGYAAYARGEVLAMTDPDAAIGPLEAAIELAGSSGADFVVGIATVTLASCAARTGRADTARAAYRDAIHYWQRAASWVQQWTTVRGAAEFLAAQGDPELAAVIVASAAADPDAPALSEEAAARLDAVRRPGAEPLPRAEVLRRTLAALG